MHLYMCGCCNRHMLCRTNTFYLSVIAHRRAEREKPTTTARKRFPFFYLTWFWFWCNVFAWMDFFSSNFAIVHVSFSVSLLLLFFVCLEKVCRSRKREEEIHGWEGEGRKKTLTITKKMTMTVAEVEWKSNNQQRRKRKANQQQISRRYSKNMVFGSFDFSISMCRRGCECEREGGRQDIYVWCCWDGRQHRKCAGTIQLLEIYALHIVCNSMQSNIYVYTRGWWWWSVGLARQKVSKNKLVATPLATRKAFSASCGAGLREKKLRKCQKN